MVLQKSSVYTTTLVHFNNYMHICVWLIQEQLLYRAAAGLHRIPFAHPLRPREGNHSNAAHPARDFFTRCHELRCELCNFDVTHSQHRRTDGKRTANAACIVMYGCRNTPYTKLVFLIVKGASPAADKLQRTFQAIQ